MGEFYLTFREEIISILDNLFLKNRKPLPKSSHLISSHLMSIPLKPKTRHKYYNKTANQYLSLRAKILKNIVANRVQKHIKDSYIMTK